AARAAAIGQRRGDQGGERRAGGGSIRRENGAGTAQKTPAHASAIRPQRAIAAPAAAGHRALDRSPAARRRAGVSVATTLPSLPYPEAPAKRASKERERGRMDCRARTPS